MRKSVSEKLQIVKEATSKKKIKMLSIRHGVTVRTIKNWLRQSENGQLQKKGREKTDVHKLNTLRKRFRYFKNIVYKVERIARPKKNCECRELFRHVFRDAGCGFVFCAYSSSAGREAVSEVFSQFTLGAARNGHFIKKITADNTGAEKGIREIAGSYGAESVIKPLAEIRNHTVFSLKKNSYIKIRSSYEDCGSFLFDSLATVCRNNNSVIEGSSRAAMMRSKIHSLNFQLHSTVTGNKSPFSEKDMNEVLDRKMKTAAEFQKKYDLENAGIIYEKLLNILDYTNINPAMLIKILQEKARISYLRKDLSGALRYLDRVLKLIAKCQLDKKEKLKYETYMLKVDTYRMFGNYKKAHYFITKSKGLLGRIGEVRTNALFHLNSGRVMYTLKRPAEALEHYTAARRIIDAEGFADLRNVIDESEAGLYSYTGRYADSKRIFGRMIEEGVYSDSPYFRAILYGKYADQFHLTGDLGKSLEIYDSALEIIDRYKEVKGFGHLAVIVNQNKGYSLYKMNEAEKAKKIFENTLRSSQAESISDQIYSSLTFLLICSLACNEIESAEKYLKDMEIMVQSSARPDMEMKYLLAHGELLREKKDFIRAEDNMLRALGMTCSEGMSRTSYFDAAIRLAELYIITSQFDKFDLLNDEVVRKADKDGHDIFKFKALIQKKKAGFIKTNNIKGYKKYLKSILRSEENDEKKYSIARELL